METLTITLPASVQQSYPIIIGNDILHDLSSLISLEKYTKFVVITDDVIGPQYVNKLQINNHIIVPSGEKTKNIDTVQTIWREMQKIGLDRKSLVINLGGGVIGDMGGFAASTYMRGIDFINIPTTLLSQVDASVGGKNGIDFAEIKNLIGTFNQPQAVIIDVQTLKTLPKREFISGFAEIIKHGLINDVEYLKTVTSKYPSEFSNEELIQIIKGSCEIKATIVIDDETEQSGRKLLNFGHTIGHAVEALSLETDKPLLHGEAVSIGMYAEAIIAKNIGHLTETDVQEIKKYLLHAELPIIVTSMAIADIKNKMKADKKNEQGTIKFALLKNIGEGIIDQIVSDEIVTDALQQIIV